MLGGRGWPKREWGKKRGLCEIQKRAMVWRPIVFFPWGIEKEKATIESLRVPMLVVLRGGEKGGGGQNRGGGLGGGKKAYYAGRESGTECNGIFRRDGGL